MNSRRLAVSASFFVAVLHCISGDLFSQDHTMEPVAGLLQRIEDAHGDQRLSYQRNLLARRDIEDTVKRRVVESMLAEYPSKSNPGGRGSALIAQAALLREQNDFSRMSDAIGEALRLGRRCKAELPEIWFDARVLQARLAKERQHHLQATTMAKEALAFAQPWGDRLELNKAYRILAVCAGNLGSTCESLKFYRLEIEYAQRVGRKHDEVAAAFPFIQQLVDFGHTEEAAAWLEKMSRLAKQIGDRRMQVLFSAFGEHVRMRQGDPKTAARNLRELMKSDLARLTKSDLCQLYLWLSQVETKLKHFDAALQANAEDLKHAEGNRNYVLDAKLQRIRILLAAAKSDQALQELNALETETKNFPEYERIRMFVASQIFFRMKNYELAFCSLAKYQKMISASNREQAADQLSFINALMNDRDRELQLAEQKQLAAEAVAAREEATSDARMATARNMRVERNLLAFGSLAIIALGLLASRFWVARKLHSQELSLNAELNQRLERRTSELAIQTANRQRLERSVERQRRDQALGQLTGGVAHDFNNLLTIIMQSNELARRFDPDLSAASQEQLQTSTQAAATGARIVKQLLGFARKSTMNPAVLDLFNWKSSVGEMFEHVVGQNHLKFSIDTTLGPRPAVEVDDALLTTAVINLLSNSRDAMDMPGSIALSVFPDHVREARACVGGEISEGHYIVIEVADDGPGMSPTQQEKACEPYYTTKVQGAGTGLGLSSVLGFVNQSRGHMQIKSERGCGTVVQIFLPRVTVPVGWVEVPIFTSLTTVQHV